MTMSNGVNEEVISKLVMAESVCDMRNCMTGALYTYYI